MRVQFWVSVGLSATLLAAGCSGDDAPRVSGTVPIASTVVAVPETIQPAPETVANAVETSVAAPTSAATTVPAVTTTTPAVTTTIGLVPAARWGPEEAKIAALLEQYTDAYWAELISKRYDIGSIDRYAEGEHLKNTADVYERGRNSTTEYRRGTVIQALVMDVRVMEGEAEAKVCARNDISLWETQGTVDVGDDVLLESGMTEQVIDYYLSRRDNQWRIFQAFSEGTSGRRCGGVS
jgi:hypothetical protein